MKELFKLSIRHLIIVGMSYQLLHFLIKENILKQFVDNCENRIIAILMRKNCRTKKECISLVRRHLSNFLGNPIYDAFLWSKTPERFSFWENIYFKWWNR